MSAYISKLLTWIPLPGFDRKKVLDEIVEGAVAHVDCGNHVWTAEIEHRGTLLYCYGLQIGEYDHMGEKINIYYVKKIPESVGPDVFDCPKDMLEMCVSKNAKWREDVIKHRGSVNK